MQFKEILNLIPPTKNIDVVLKNKTDESYTNLYLGVASKMPAELGEYELRAISSTLIDARMIVLIIGVKENEDE